MTRAGWDEPAGIAVHTQFSLRDRLRSPPNLPPPAMWPNPPHLGDLSAENLKEDAMELSLSVRGGWKTVRFDIVPVVRRQQEPLRLEGRQRGRGFPEGSLQKATAEAHFIPASPHCWR